ncbi:MAG: shikimate dehydrogenase [Salibacteraceae bacterium]
MIKAGLIGFPLQHSRSKELFENHFNSLGIEASYKLVEIPNCADAVRHCLSSGFIGFNVTIPFKKQVLNFMNRLETEAEQTRAVNCVVLSDDELIGYNTDCHGFAALMDEAQIEPYQRQALILGDGGAAAAVKFVLHERGISHHTVSRNTDLNYINLSASMIREVDIIINTTPVGMWPETNACPDIPYEAITSDHVCIDLIYNPEETLFMSRCKILGAKVLNGKTMLVKQAQKSWEIWLNEWRNRS